MEQIASVMVTSPQTRPKYDPPATRPRSPAATRAASPANRVPPSTSATRQDVARLIGTSSAPPAKNASGGFSESRSRAIVASPSSAQASGPQLTSSSTGFVSSVAPAHQPHPSSVEFGSSPSRPLFEVDSGGGQATSAQSSPAMMSSAQASSTSGGGAAQRVKPPEVIDKLQNRLAQLEHEARIVARQLHDEETKAALAARVVELEQALSVARGGEEQQNGSSLDVRQRLNVLESAMLAVTAHFAPEFPSPPRRSAGQQTIPSASSPAARLAFMDRNGARDSQPLQLPQPPLLPPSIFSTTPVRASSPPSFARSQMPLEDYCAQAALYASALPC